MVAALWLMAKGYRILGFRLKTRQAEIDLLALRGQSWRSSRSSGARPCWRRLETVTRDQRDRLRRAGASAGRRPPGPQEAAPSGSTS